MSGWNATLALALAALAPSCGSGSEPAWGDGPAPPNLLFLSIDTLRADHLGFYGYERPTSPRMDAFASEATVFDAAQASASWTLPGLASILTSYYSSTHNCWSFGSRLDESFTTLTEILSAAGFDTACVTSHLFLTTRHGLQQGFVHFDDTYAYPAEDPEDAVTSDVISDKGIRFLQQKAAAREAGRDAEPWFLWLHYFDPHDNYLEHEGISERFRTPGERSLAQIDVDRYDGEIAFTDLHVGRVLDALATNGLADDTIVVLFSDHGEEFLDHGALRHGHTLYSELVRIPLVIRLPEGTPGRVEQVVRSVDVFPTILDLMGLPTPGGIEGQSLRPLFAGGTVRDLPALAEIRLDQGALLEALVLGRYKLVRRLSDGALRLYDLEADPGETRDVQAEHPDVVERMERLLTGTVREAGEKADRFHIARDLDLPPSVLDQLEGLGYLNR